jgi:hypothetical protein
LLEKNERESTNILILAAENIGSNHRLLFISRDIPLGDELREENGRYGVTGALLLLPYSTSTCQMGASLSGGEWQERTTVSVLP